MIEALTKVSFDWSLTLAGDGESKEYVEGLQRRSRDLQIDHRISWLGWIKPNERWTLLEAADLLVLPSHNENFANVVIESLSVGTPVLVSRYVGLADYVEENNMGWVCDTTVENIQEKLTQANDQKSLRHQISERSATQIREDFDPTILVNRYIDMYQKAAI